MSIAVGFRLNSKLYSTVGTWVYETSADRIPADRSRRGTKAPLHAESTISRGRQAPPVTAGARGIYSFIGATQPDAIRMQSGIPMASFQNLTTVPALGT